MFSSKEIIIISLLQNKKIHLAKKTFLVSSAIKFDLSEYIFRYKFL